MWEVINFNVAKLAGEIREISGLPLGPKSSLVDAISYYTCDGVMADGSPLPTSPEELSFIAVCRAELADQWEPALQ